MASVVNPREKAWHTFRVRGSAFLFDTTGCRFYEIDTLMYKILSMLSNYSILSVRARLQRTHYSTKRIDATINAVKELGAMGLFDRHKNFISHTAAKKALRNYDFVKCLTDVELMLAENCNLKCKYCWCPSNHPSGQLMSKSTAKIALDMLFEYAGAEELRITLFGGEPLLNKKVIDYVENYSKELSCKYGKKITYVMTTNATLLDKKNIDYIVNDNYALMVSLDGPRELHDKQCPMKNGKSSYEIALSNIKQIMARRTVGVRATLCHPLPNIKKLIDFFSRSRIPCDDARTREESRRTSDPI